MTIKYRKLKGYKYQLTTRYVVPVPLDYPMASYETIYKWVALRNSTIYIRKGYCWDGPSGIAIDTKNFMRGSLVHDALYQLFRENRHIAEEHRDTADRLLQAMCIEDGMFKFRAAWVYWGVHTFGAKSAGL